MDVYEYLLKNARGAENAVRGRDLAGYFGTDIRVIADIAKKLLERDKLLIGSCSRGYFAIASQEDTDIAVGKLKPMGISILKRCAILENKSVRVFTNQLILELEDEEENDRN